MDFFLLSIYYSQLMLIQYRVFPVQKYTGDTYSIENEIRICNFFLQLALVPHLGSQSH